MAIHVDLSNLGTSHIDELLAKDLSEKMMDARIRLERALSEKILDMHCSGYSHIYIVRWQEHEANVFRWSGQIFTPDEEHKAKALAVEKHGEVEIVEFREPPEIDIVYLWQRLCGDPADGKAQI